MHATVNLSDNNQPTGLRSIPTPSTMPPSREITLSSNMKGLLQALSLFFLAVPTQFSNAVDAMLLAARDGLLRIMRGLSRRRMRDRLGTWLVGRNRIEVGLMGQSGGKEV